MNESHYTQPQINKLYNYAHVRSLNRRWHAKERRIVRKLYKECFCYMILLVATLVVILSLIYDHN